MYSLEEDILKWSFNKVEISEFIFRNSSNSHRRNHTSLPHTVYLEDFKQSLEILNKILKTIISDYFAYQERKENTFNNNNYKKGNMLSLDSF